MDVIADRADRGPDAHGGFKQRHGLRRCAAWAVGVRNPVPPAGRRTCSRRSWPVLGSSRRTKKVVPLHVDAAADPPRRRPVVGRVDFHASIEVHGADGEAVIPKRLERQCAERRLLLGKHRGDLTFRRAVNARVGPVRFPAIEIGLRRLQRLETQATQRRLLHVPDARFDLALAIGIADPTRQRDGAVVREDIAVERIQRRIVDVRGEDTFFEIVEDDDADRPTQATKRALVEARPRPVCSSATRGAGPLCASSRASGRRAACAGYLPVCG